MAASSQQDPTVAIVGGGLAGIAAGCVLADSGFAVSLFERRPYLGGRASSYEHPGTGETVDNCQHVLLGCCTNLIRLYARLGAEDKIRWFERLNFLEPGGRISVIEPSPLPAPLHTGPAFLRAACLNLQDKLGVAAAMAALMPAAPPDSGQSFLTWLRNHGQTERAIERFWKTILVSALNEDLDRIAVPYAAQVVRESFLKSASAGRMGVPTVPLTELYGVAEKYIVARGGRVEYRSAVEGFRGEPGGVRLLVGGQEHAFDFAVLAVPFDSLGRILPQTAAAEPLRQALTRFETSPITGIHFWFDRQITDLEHAVLLDRTIQWMFHKSKLLAAKSTSNSRRDVSAANTNGSYVELVVSASKSLVDKSKAEIEELALNELREFFPSAREATVVKSTVIKEVHATYSPQPGVDSFRPRSETAWPRIFLAGDWTDTGWPATMEGAVRSGYVAAEHVAGLAKVKNASFLQADLRASGFMRIFQ